MVVRNLDSGDKRAVKVTAFIVVKSGGQLSERTIAKNRCQGPAKPKGVAHLDIDYRSKKDSQSVERTIKNEDSVY